MTTPPHFISVDYQRIKGRGDRVIVLCDRDRPEGLPHLIGREIEIDGANYRVTATEGDLRQSLRKGQQIVAWVTALTKETLLPSADE